MSKEQILQAFNGRWRIKVESAISNHQEQTPITYDVLRRYCLDFFKTGILIGEINNENFTNGVCNGHIVSEEEMVVVDRDKIPNIIPENKLFSYWWKLYDKMVGRKDCEKKWAKLSSKEKEACIRATPAYVASTPDKQFRKNPLSYLNQKAWNDEIIPRNNGTDYKLTIDQQRISKLADILTD